MGQSKNGFPEILPKKRSHGLGELKASKQDESQEDKQDRKVDPSTKF
jgi:hypothetical protein